MRFINSIPDGLAVVFGSLAVFVCIALVVHWASGHDAKPPVSVLRCITASGKINTPPDHWRYDAGSYTNGKYRIFIAAPAACKLETVK